MRELPEWRHFAVQQRRPASGCIPTGYEMLVRADGLSNVDLNSFQDDFDLDKDLGPGDLPRNNFESVASAVQAKYPHVRFRAVHFPRGRGNEKLALIESYFASNRAILVSLALHGAGLGWGFHIMPVVGDDEDELLLLKSVGPDGTRNGLYLPKSDLVRIHDNYPGGDDVAFLDEGGSRS
jgi:hypothetical protein